MVTGAAADEVLKKIMSFHRDAAGRQLRVLQDVCRSGSDSNQRSQIGLAAAGNSVRVQREITNIALALKANPYASTPR